MELQSTLPIIREYFYHKELYAHYNSVITSNVAMQQSAAVYIRFSMTFIVKLYITEI